MLFNLLLLFTLLFMLFILSQKISSSIYKCVYLLTKSRNIGLAILLIFQLPGTIIHELSHFFMASIFRVRTRELTIIPKIEKNGEVKAGRLVYDSVDPLRQALIGLAPMIIGLTIIYFIGRSLLTAFSQSIAYNLQLTTIIGFYLLFITSFTMFSSKKDLESLVITGPIFFLILMSLYFTGVRLYFENALLEKINSVVSDLNHYLIIATIIDGLIYLFLSGNLYLWQKILKRKIS